MIAELDALEADEVPEKNVEIRGAPARLFELFDIDPDLVPQEILIDGPAGTGKTRGVWEFVDTCCWKFPGIRVLICRQTRKSMSESTLVEWEEEVLGSGHPAITGERKRDDRQHYTYPNGTDKRPGSHVVLVGLDKPENTFSMQFDIIVVEEAVQTTPISWEKLARSNRNWKMPFQLRIAVTNPGAPMHWLIRRALGNSIMERWPSRHEDNPAYYVYNEEDGTWNWSRKGKKYIHGNLAGSLSGSTRARLYDGLWQSEEGLVYENWDPAVHMLDAKVRIDVRAEVDGQPNPRIDMPYMDENGSLWIDFHDRDVNSVEITWVIGGQDWGDVSPGCQLVFGIDKEHRMFLISQVYRTRKHTDWWADLACEHVRMFGMLQIACDSANPERIEIFNDRMGTPGGREEDRIALKANKSKDTGISELQYRIGNIRDEDSGEVVLPPAFFVLKDCLRRGVQTGLRDKKKPWDWETEIGAFTMRENEDGKPEKDEPDPTCANHAMDAGRYAAMLVHRKDLSEDRAPTPWSDRSGTMGELVGHDELEDWE